MNLTPTQRRVLTALRDAEDSGDYYNAEIVCSGIECWLGIERISRMTVTKLVEMVLVSYDDLGGTGHYTINGSGRAALKDESVIDRIQVALLTNQQCDETGNPIL